MPTIRNDEPVTEDHLDREKYARALAEIAASCESPSVIGLYGSWGVGKTSLMRMIVKKLNEAKVVTVEYSPWHHQFDETPALALAQSMASQLGLGESETKKLLTCIGLALGSILLKKIGLTLGDVDNLGKRYEEERFQIREHQLQLRYYFDQLIQQGLKKHKVDRIVVFIDDLDRCMPQPTIQLLEALKIYLNIDNCVFFLGVDRAALQKSIGYHFKDLPVSDEQYLDKIVQVPFYIPPIDPDSLGKFVSPLLSDGLKDCREMLAEGIGGNPRRIKRFVNQLILNHQIAETAIDNFNSKILCFVLLIQYFSPDLWGQITAWPDLLSLILKRRNDDIDGKKALDGIEASHELKAALKLIDPQKEVPPDVRQYVDFSQTTSDVPFLNRHEWKHLTLLSADYKNLHYSIIPAVRDELRHLRRLGLIQIKENRRIADIPGSINIYDYCLITEKGKDYIRLRGRR